MHAAKFIKPVEDVDKSVSLRGVVLISAIFVVTVVIETSTVTESVYLHHLSK